MVKDQTINSVKIVIPTYLTLWDLEKELNKAMRQIVEYGNICIINMEKVRNVYSATIQLLQRIIDRATRFACSVYIVNASEIVCNALKSAGIDEKVPVFSKEPLPELIDY